MGTRGSGGFEKRLVDESGVSFAAYEAVFAGPVNGVGIPRALVSLVKMGVGLLQSFAMLLRHRPQAILFTGGWANVPVAVAAWLLRVPMLIYLPDIEPGRTIQLLSKLGALVATTTPDSAQYFKDGQTVVTGYPLRRAITTASRERAIDYLGLDAERTTIMVTGGSRGARNINIAIENIAPQLIELNAQIIHITGELDWERSQARMADYGDLAHYHARAYLDSEEMGLAFAAADIIIGRSGASVLGEFPYFGAASVLIPYPFAWRYQKTNADYLVAHGAAVRVDDEKMAADLLPTLRDLLQDEQRLNEMRACARALDSGNGAQNIAQALRKLAKETTTP